MANETFLATTIAIVTLQSLNVTMFMQNVTFQALQSLKLTMGTIVPLDGNNVIGENMIYDAVMIAYEAAEGASENGLCIDGND